MEPADNQLSDFLVRASPVHQLEYLQVDLAILPQSRLIPVAPFTELDQRKGRAQIRGLAKMRLKPFTLMSVYTCFPPPDVVGSHEVGPQIDRYSVVRCQTYGGRPREKG